LGSVGASEHDASMPVQASVDIEQLARLQGAEVVETPEDLVEDIWGPEELEAFLVDLRASRDASLA
jgi:hypothetical protein